MADDPELALLLAAARSVFHADGPPIEDMAGRPIDWGRFLQLARFHRIEGLVWRGFGQANSPLSADVADGLRGRAQRIAAANLAMARESERLRAAFDQAGIDLLFIKGATLAQLAYGDLGAKAATDIDVLIAPAAIGEGARIIGELGFRPVIPDRSSALRQWHSMRKESLWLQDSTGIALDLHTRLAESPDVIPQLWRPDGIRLVQLGRSIVLPTLNRDELATYLAVHGVSSAWFRLKWIVDFAALLEREHRGRVGELRSAMRSLGAQWAGDQALLLADQLFGSLADEPALRSVVADRWPVRWANSIALAYLRRGKEPTERIGGTLGQHIAQLLLLESTAPRLRELARKARMLANRAPA